MPRLRPLVLAGYAALAVADAVLAGSPGPRATRLRRVTKPLLMPALGVSCATDPRARSTRLRGSTALGLGCGWLGDVALLRTGTVPFLGGMAAFAAGQLAYTVGFRRLGGAGPVLRAPSGVLAGSLFAIAGPVLARGAARQDRVLGPAVLAYAALICAMAAHAAALDPRLPDEARRLTAAGAATFVASDLLLGSGQFLLDRPPPWLEGAVMATYTAAQYLLAEGALRLGEEAAQR